MSRSGSAPPVTSRNKAQNQSPLRISLLSASKAVARCRKGWAVGPLLCVQTAPDPSEGKLNKIGGHRAGQAEQVQTTSRVPPVKFSPEQTGFLNVFFGFRLLVTFVRTVCSPTSYLVCFELNRKIKLSQIHMTQWSCSLKKFSRLKKLQASLSS